MVLVGHTRDDLAETAAMRMARGTGRGDAGASDGMRRDADQGGPVLPSALPIACLIHEPVAARTASPGGHSDSPRAGKIRNPKSRSGPRIPSPCLEIVAGP